MNLEDMLSKFRQRTSNLADALSDTDATGYLNRWYRFMVPTDVDGEYFEGVYHWQIAVNEADPYFAPDSVLALPEYIISVHTQQIWLTGYTEQGIITRFKRRYLDIETNREVWNVADRQDPYHGDPASSTPIVRGQPTSILVDGRFLALSPPPDRNYEVAIPVREGPEAVLGTASGESNGVADEVYAMAVVSGAASEYLVDVEDFEHAAVQEAEYEKYIERMQTRSTGRASHRRPMRSYK